MTDHLEFGKRVRFYRKRRGVQQRQLGELLGRSEDWVYRVETGRIPVNNVKMLADLADALRVHLEDLQGTPVLLEDSDGFAASVPAIRAALMQSRRLAGSLITNREPLRLGLLEMEVGTAWELYQAGEFASLADRLPRLLADARSAMNEASGDERRAAQRLFALACHVAAALLRKLGETNLAWTAADQGEIAALESGDTAAILSLRRGIAHVQLGANLAAEAVKSTLDSADGLERGWWESSPVALSLYGTLFLNGSIAAARMRNREMTTYMLGKANEAAERLGADGNEMWTAFGPANVGIHRLATALEFEDYQRAVDIAPTVRAVGLPKERRARLRLDVARAYGEAGQTDDAVDNLKRAYRTAPEQMKAHEFARDLARRLHKRTHRRDAQQLAVALGAIA
ncbi:helix-turn-helix domain-containing protein [Streptomyces sp. WZ-12]|uniref:helix-turn-helix domain-containing protein n=1 Tax=Streptomyces sp. WZ-12 TaxID=3030210 RepID=UPI002381329B|nr:helix-turn-helix transcriptional regulator [Streptomyces sp. WZ-12]